MKGKKRYTKPEIKKNKPLQNVIYATVGGTIPPDPLVSPASTI